MEKIDNLVAQLGNNAEEDEKIFEHFFQLYNECQYEQSLQNSFIYFLNALKSKDQNCYIEKVLQSIYEEVANKNRSFYLVIQSELKKNSDNSGVYNKMYQNQKRWIFFRNLLDKYENGDEIFC